MRPITLTLSFTKGSFVTGLKLMPRIDIRLFGNLRKTSTTHCLVHLVHTILSELEKPNVWLKLVLVDFQKAFDLGDHNILIRLLQDNFEIDPLSVNIVISFLSNRPQVVKYKNRYCGIPQGTLLGPLLFLVMISEIDKEFPQR